MKPVASTLFSVLALVALPMALPAQDAAKLPPAQPTIQQQLVHSVIQDQAENVKLLLTKGGDPNASTALAAEDRWFLNDRPNSDPTPPLFIVACHFMGIKEPNIVQILLDKGAKVNLTDKSGATPLMYASELGGNVRLLLEHNADVNAADKEGKTALLYCMNNLGQGTAEQLLSHGARINVQDNNGYTALMLAISDARHDPINLILDDQKKKEILSKQRYLDLIQFLIDSHANVNLKNKSGQTALSLAKGAHETEVVKMLKKAGAK